jgi:peptidyl-prolyl cis-trans isomerase D
VAAIILVFALFGFGSITTFLVNIPEVATVNGEDITEQEMLIAVERNRQRILGNASQPLDIDDDELTRSTLNDLIERELLSQSADRLELFYSDERIDQDMLNTDAFQIDGKFDAERFQLTLRSAGYSPVNYKETIKSERMYEQVNRGLGASGFVTEAEVLTSARLAQQTRDIAFLKVEVDKIKADITVTDSQVEQYYAEHQQEFMTDETVNLHYVELLKSDLSDDVSYQEAELQSFYEEEKDRYSTQEERRLAHILIEINDVVSEQAAKDKIDGIRERITKGEPFADLAVELSEDTGSAAEGGDLGFNARGIFVTEFDEAAFSLSANQMSEPVLTEFGYHIIKLLEVREATIPEFDDIVDKLDKDLRFSKAEELFVEQSARLSEISYESADLQDPAAELGLSIQTTGHFGRSGGEGISANSQVVQAAFSEDLLLDNNNSDVIEIDPNHHVVVRIYQHEPSEVSQLSSVKEEIGDLLASNVARIQAKEQTDEMLTMLKGGSITKFVADQFGLEWSVHAAINRNQLGLDAQIVRGAFRLPRPAEGDKSLGTAWLGNGDSVVISVTKVADKEDNSLPAAEIRNLGRYLAIQQGQNDYMEFRQQLKEKAEITRTQ